MGVMRVLNSKGDTETSWDPKDKRSVTQAEQVFDMHKHAELTAYVPDEHGVGADEIKKFDPDAREIIFTRQLAGG